jgi:hypothetical protein
MYQYLSNVLVLGRVDNAAPPVRGRESLWAHHAFNNVTVRINYRIEAATPGAARPRSSSPGQNRPGASREVG